MCQLFEVVHQAKQFPLPIHFVLASQGEAVQAFVAAQVPKHGFDGDEALDGNFTPSMATALCRLSLGGHKSVALGQTVWQSTPPHWQ
jgi:hypothetical protein